jgi:hypothetical protein
MLPTWERGFQFGMLFVVRGFQFGICSEVFCLETVTVRNIWGMLNVEDPGNFFVCLEVVK